MKIENKVILLSLLTGLLVWTIDALFDHLFFYKGGFLNLLILDVPSHELYIRTIIFFSFLGFGIFISGMVGKLNAVNTKNQKLVTELQAALRDVKIMSGLLPICSSCKQIRDDKGEWHPLEPYIRDHSEVEFSHSICPACIDKLYPEYKKKK